MQDSTVQACNFVQSLLRSVKVWAIKLVSEEALFLPQYRYDDSNSTNVQDFHLRSLLIDYPHDRHRRCPQRICLGLGALATYSLCHNTSFPASVSHTIVTTTWAPRSSISCAATTGSAGHTNMVSTSSISGGIASTLSVSPAPFRGPTVLPRSNPFARAAYDAGYVHMHFRISTNCLFARQFGKCRKGTEEGCSTAHS